jgi:hypothetical protein
MGRSESKYRQKGGEAGRAVQKSAHFQVCLSVPPAAHRAEKLHVISKYADLES